MYYKTPNESQQTQLKGSAMPTKREAHEYMMIWFVLNLFKFKLS